LRADGRRSGLLASEVRLVFTRPRTLALLGVLAAVPVVLALAARFAAPSLPGDGPPLLDRVTEQRRQHHRCQFD
jgi:ABC-2 type transport system permease protein